MSTSSIRRADRRPLIGAGTVGLLAILIAAMFAVPADARGSKVPKVKVMSRNP